MLNGYDIFSDDGPEGNIAMLSLVTATMLSLFANIATTCPPAPGKGVHPKTNVSIRVVGDETTGPSVGYTGFPAVSANGKWVAAMTVEKSANENGETVRLQLYWVRNGRQRQSVTLQSDGEQHEIADPDRYRKVL